MVKTTVNLEDEVYKKLVREAVDKYGTTRTLSKLINEKLKMGDATMITSRKGEIDIVQRAFGSWKTKESSSEFVRKLRRESERRLRRLRIQ